MISDEEIVSLAYEVMGITPDVFRWADFPGLDEADMILFARKLLALVHQENVGE